MNDINDQIKERLLSDCEGRKCYTEGGMVAVIYIDDATTQPRIFSHGYGNMDTDVVY